MALQTNAVMAEKIQVAIIAILEGAQSYSIGEGPESKTFNRGDLGTLQSLYKYYKNLADQEASAGRARVGITYPVF